MAPRLTPPGGNESGETYLENGNSPDEPCWILQCLQAREPVHAFSFDGAWFGIGMPGSYFNEICHQLEDAPSIAPSARLEIRENGTGTVFVTSL
ncbi:hypothetical protein [Natronorubrum sp. A-ect3]|uniref:hypothetical protein n=1 Tax=Natronorubrum sp. A-ect3 TaxID=3242698 RepID=UPI00359ECCBF